MKYELFLGGMLMSCCYMTGVCLISLVSFIFDVILFHMRTINHASISQSQWNPLDKTQSLTLPLRDMLMHEQKEVESSK